MHLIIAHLVVSFSVTLVALLAVAGLLHLLPRLGEGISDALCHAPILDVSVTYFTAAPLVWGPIIGGWAGLVGAIAGQVASVLIWSLLHELAHLPATRGPRIVKTMNRILGRFRNHAAIWTTAPVAPVFTLVRIAELTLYPMLTALVGLPAYNQREWVNVSRQKFAGLVGHDLIWCLYCDWMTGVVSMEVEMLRNVETFWCPIRFASGKKCDNCKLDFPDIEVAWVNADATMADVTAKLETLYAGGERSWYGKRVGITVRGQPIEASPPREVDRVDAHVDPHPDTDPDPDAAAAAADDVESSPPREVEPTTIAEHP